MFPIPQIIRNETHLGKRPTAEKCEAQCARGQGAPRDTERKEPREERSPSRLMAGTTRLDFHRWDNSVLEDEVEEREKQVAPPRNVDFGG